MNDKEVFAYRVDKDLVNAARKRGINVRALLEDSLARVAAIKKCPTCNQKVVAKRKKVVK